MTNKTKVLKKKYVLIGLLIVALLAFSLYGAYYFFSNGFYNYHDFKSVSIAICDKEPNEISKNDCYSFTARDFRDYSICDNITSDIGQANCYTEIASVTGNASICELITWDFERRDQCRLEMILPKKDPELCEALIYPDKKYDCYSSLASATDNYELCDKISGIKRTMCYEGMAIKKKMPELCNKLQKVDKDSCITNLADELNNASYCEEINDTARDSCYVRLSEKLRDKTLCAKVESKQRRINCES